MKIQINIDAPTIEHVEAELRRVLDNMRHNGKCVFVREDKSEFCTTSINIIDGFVKPYGIGVEVEENGDVVMIQYCDTEEEAQKVMKDYPGSDIYEFDPSYSEPITPEYIDI